MQMAGSLAAVLQKLEAKPASRLEVHETVIVDVLHRIMRLPALSLSWGSQQRRPPLPPVPEKEMGFHTTIKTPARRK